jgi:hypothetical protein
MVSKACSAAPSAPSDSYKAEETCREKPGGKSSTDGWRWHCVDDDLPIAGLEIGNQDLVGAGVEGAAPATG